MVPVWVIAVVPAHSAARAELSWRGLGHAQLSNVASADNEESKLSQKTLAVIVTALLGLVSPCPVVADAQVRVCYLPLVLAASPRHSKASCWGTFVSL